MMLLLILAGFLLLGIVGMGTFWVLVQLGVIAQKAMEPPISDTNNYSLQQGKDVAAEEQR